jgi:hypothetical protein
MDNRKSPQMKKDLNITTSLDQPDLLESMVEKLAQKRVEQGFGKQKAFGDWQPVDTSCIEKYVSGTMDMAIAENEKIKMPFVTCFLFSCTKEKNEAYKLHWSMSLS